MPSQKPGDAASDTDTVTATRPVLSRVLAAAGVALVVVIVALTVVRAARAWPREAHLDYVEGIWIGLAIDASHGTFYRPLEGPLGLGGTRYFPLFVGLHALIIRAGLDGVAAGYLLSAGAVALLLSGVALLLRRLGASSLMTAVAVAVTLACQPVQMGLLAIRGDVLAAAFAMLGLAVCAAGRGAAPAAVLFTLAFATKPTSLYAAAGAVLLLALERRRPEALRLALYTIGGVAATVVTMELASGGHALATIAASAGGGAGIASALGAPLSFARILRRVPESAFFIQLAAAVLLVRLFRPTHVAEAAWLTGLGATIVIYASPATIENHLVDLAVVAVVVVAGLAARRPEWAPAVLAVLLAGGVSSAASVYWRSATLDTVDRRSGREAVLAEIGASRHRMLSDQPMLYAAAGVSPYLLDPYLFSVRLARDPGAADRLVDDLERRAFDVVVLEHTSLDLLTAETFPGQGGQRFRAALVGHYQHVATIGRRAVYRPR